MPSFGYIDWCLWCQVTRSVRQVEAHYMRFLCVLWWLTVQERVCLVEIRKFYIQNLACYQD